MEYPRENPGIFYGRIVYGKHSFSVLLTPHGQMIASF